jgi:hypothetical protein
MGNAARQVAFHLPHLVSNLSGQAAGDRLAIIEMPQAVSHQLSAMAGIGTFFAGQVPHSDTAIAALADHRKVLVVRELRSTLVSCLLSEQQSPSGEPASGRQSEGRSQMLTFLRQQGPSLFGQFLSILTWMAERDVVILRVEDLQQRDTAAIDRLARLLRIDMHSAINLDRTNLDRANLDRAGSFRPIRLDDFWSTDTEQLFSAFGGRLWNRALGYDQSYEAGSRDVGAQCATV